MPRYAVPILVKIPAIAVVDAQTAAEAKRAITRGAGTLECLAANNVANVAMTEGAIVRSGPVKRVDAELDQLLRRWDNDNGVPW